jgi:hypothetical protein
MPVFIHTVAMLVVFTEIIIYVEYQGSRLFNTASLTLFLLVFLLLKAFDSSSTVTETNS